MCQCFGFVCLLLLFCPQAATKILFESQDLNLRFIQSFSNLSHCIETTQHNKMFKANISKQLA